MKVMKNVANTSVVRWGGRVMCLWEGGDPYEVDGLTMETVGTVDLVGCRRRSDEEIIDRAVARRDRGRRGGGGGAAVVDVMKEVGVDVAAGLLKPILHGKFI